jgi:hypothetical protein
VGLLHNPGFGRFIPGGGGMIFPNLTLASKARRPFVIGEPELFLEVNVDFWQFRQILPGPQKKVDKGILSGYNSLYGEVS